MQRTEDLAVLKGAGAQRPAPVRASVVDAIKLSVQIPDREFAALHMDRAAHWCRCLDGERHMVSQRTKQIMRSAGLAHCIASLDRVLGQHPVLSCQQERIALQLIEIESEWPTVPRTVH